MRREQSREADPVLTAHAVLPGLLPSAEEARMHKWMDVSQVPGSGTLTFYPDSTELFKFDCRCLGKESWYHTGYDLRFDGGGIFEELKLPDLEVQSRPCLELMVWL